MKHYQLGDDSGPQPASGLDYDKDLNPQQREVVESRADRMLVIAGAGTGKTHTLTYRVAHLIDSGVEPRNILLLTFTNRAAASMTDRVAGLLGLEPDELWSGTFHSIANRILRREADRLDYELDYTVLDNEDRKTLMGECRSESSVPTTESNFPKAKTLGSIYSYCINTQSTVQEVLRERHEHFTHRADEVRRVFRLYRSRKLEMNLMDFDDLLSNLQTLLTEVDDVRETYRERFDHVLVDEYHDTNAIQGELVDNLVGDTGNLMVVGDDCQSIYAFRGANYKNILQFPDRHPDCEEFRLEINYRSTPEILALANASIRKNEHQFQKELRAQRPSGPRPALVKVRDANQQAAFICQRILELVDEGRDFSQIAVLYRSHYHSMELQVEMAHRDIPYVVRSGLRFFEKAHIKDVLAHLRFIYNPDDELSFLRVAKMGTGIGDKRARDAWMYLSAQDDPLAAIDDGQLVQTLPRRAASAWETIAERLAAVRDLRMESPGRTVEAVLDRGYRRYVRDNFDNPQERLDDLEQFAEYAHQYPDLDRFLGEISLLTDVSSKGVLVGDRRDSYVTLSSVHQAKGLEWDAVFMLAMADEQFPHRRSLGDDESIEEERRLFYVAVTRTRDELYLCQPLRTRHRGRLELQRTSRFIKELEDEHHAADDGLWETWRVED